MFDSHCHVTDIEDPVAVLRQAHQAGVDSLLCCGYHAESNARVIALRRQVVGLPVAIGLHPWFATESIAPVLALIEQEAPNAIGECGLDGYDRDPEIPPLVEQFSAFESQLQLASRLRIPVTVHSRRAVNEVVDIAQHFPSVRGVLHAYAGSYEQVKPLLEQGWLVGVGGGSTRPRAQRIRRMATRLSLDHLLFETDSPAIGLEGVKPPDVRPHHVVEVARAFAELRHLSVDEVVSRTDANACRIFGTSVFECWSVPGEVRRSPSGLV